MNGDASEHLARRIVLGVLYARIVLTPITPLVLAINPIDRDLPNLPLLLAASALTVAVSAALAVATLGRGGVALLDRPAVMLGDIVIAVGVNLVVSASFPEGTFWWPSRDPLLIYAVLVVITWGCRRGLRALAVGAVGIVLLLGAMAAVNGTPAIGDGSERAILFARSADAFLGLTIGLVLIRLARTQATEIEASAILAGRQAGQGETMQHLHDTALATIESITQRARQAVGRGGASEQGEVLRDIHRSAAAESARLRRLLEVGLQHPDGDVRTDLEVLCAQHADAGCLFVVAPGTSPPLDDQVRAGLLAATGEAIRNARQHADASTIHVSLDVEDAAIVVRVVDNGSGFDPARDVVDRHGIRGSIIERMKSIGGGAELQTSSELGTAWVLRAPLAAPNGRVGRSVAQRQLLGALGFVLVGGLLLLAGERRDATAAPAEAGPVGVGAPDPVVFERGWLANDGMLGSADGPVERHAAGCVQRFAGGASQLAAFACREPARAVLRPWVEALDELGGGGRAQDLAGWPYNEVHDWGGSLVQDYAGGAWGAVVGVQYEEQVFWVRNPMRAWFIEAGGPDGLVGPPVGQLVEHPDGSVSQAFLHATVRIGRDGEVDLTVPTD